MMESCFFKKKLKKDNYNATLKNPKPRKADFYLFNEYICLMLEKIGLQQFFFQIIMS